MTAGDADPARASATATTGVTAARATATPAGRLRDIADVAAVEIISTAAVHLMSAAAVAVGLADGMGDGTGGGVGDGGVLVVSDDTPGGGDPGSQTYGDLAEARILITALAGLITAAGPDLGPVHARSLRDGLRSLQLAFREASVVPDPPGSGPGETWTGPVALSLAQRRQPTTPAPG